MNYGFSLADLILDGEDFLIIDIPQVTNSKALPKTPTQPEHVELRSKISNTTAQVRKRTAHQGQNNPEELKTKTVKEIQNRNETSQSFLTYVFKLKIYIYKYSQVSAYILSKMWSLL